MEEKKSGKALVAILCLIIGIIVGGTIIYFVKDFKPTKKCDTTSQVETTKEESQETVASKTITFDGSKSINSKGVEYTLSCQGNAGIWVYVDSTQKVLTFSFTPSKVVSFYSLNWTSNNNTTKDSKINFDKKIVDIYFGGMGQSVSGDTLFILLEDGTVEYIPVVHAFNNAQAEIISYGAINGISDIIGFKMASTDDGVTTLAIKNDGTFYDLWYSLKDTKNY